ncbi:DUF4249 domain-containing protein [Belliella kenyensis]|uniref:DUF4249 domain-containing protein n=1 Tax=Belliella kenyensis TaxID=1472724 RepID=A0ABV8EI39_9BACT|nr:DUF4249 domain-containing protein [Belliella kenyensis]MCH7400911.1 DUF4249 domain-containing protein [Belliella kenyensis]MDN3603910.1 DUF4249 domain-containing protein [Belliella kenyensis]
MKLTTNCSKLLLILTAFLSACETVVDIDIPFEKPLITINSILEDSENPIVRLTFSKHILDNNYIYDPIANATVTIRKDLVDHDLVFDQSAGNYINQSIYIEPGSTYTLTIDVPNYERIEVTETVPQVVPIISFTVNGTTEMDYYTREDVSLVFQDPVGENFYEISAYNVMTYRYPNQIGEIVEHRTEQTIYLTPKNPVYQREYSSNTLLFNDRLFDGSQFEMEMFSAGSSFTFNPNPGHVNPDFEVEVESYIILKSVSRSYYLYQTTFNLQRWTDGDPFAQPVQVYNNIPKGLGVFATQASYVYRVR